MNYDGAVDVVDLLYLVDAFGSVLGDANYNPDCDFNSDGFVDVVDLLILVENFGLSLEQAQGQPQSIAEEFGADNMSRDAGYGGMTVYDALESVGLLDVYLEYIAEHPEAAP